MAGGGAGGQGRRGWPGDGEGGLGAERMAGVGYQACRAEGAWARLALVAERTAAIAIIPIEA